MVQLDKLQLVCIAGYCPNVSFKYNSNFPGNEYIYFCICSTLQEVL